MEFRFNVNNLLPKRINKITHTLLPEGFRGDRREYNECQRLLTRILDDIGEASAKAQGLNRTITSAVKLRDTDHIIYLMVDNQANKGLGSVLGLLKTGSKSLFMFDDNGYHYQLKPRCILDFYIHESQQRKGLGSELYEHMLAEENLKPIKLAIDRPSDKFLAFLKRNYGLTSIIPQNNKFVVFKGFFDDEAKDSQSNNRYSSSNSQNQKCNDDKIQSNNNNAQSVRDSSISGSISGSPVTRSAYGRYAASRPPCSMASIIHDTAAMGTTDYPRSARSRRSASLVRPDSLSLYREPTPEKEIADEVVDESKNIEDEVGGAESISSLETQPEVTSEFVDAPEMIDDNAAALPDSSDQYFNENLNNDDACTSASKCSQDDASSSHQTSGGHLDLKFYHSPLW